MECASSPRCVIENYLSRCCASSFSITSTKTLERLRTSNRTSVDEKCRRAGNSRLDSVFDIILDISLILSTGQTLLESGEVQADLGSKQCQALRLAWA